MPTPRIGLPVSFSTIRPRIITPRTISMSREIGPSPTMSRTLYAAGVAPSALLDATWLNAILECALCGSGRIGSFQDTPTPVPEAMTSLESILGATQILGLQGHR